MRIEPLCEGFLSYLLVERNCSPLTIQAYRSDGRSFIEALDYLGLARETEAVGKQVIRSYVVLLRNRGLGPATIARRLHSLRSFWNYLWDNDYAEGNPLRLVSLPRRPRRLPVHLSEEDCRLVLAAAREQRSSFLACRDTALLTFLLMTGARRAEVLNLTWSDVDLSQLIVRLRGAKGDKTRVVPLAAEVAEALNLWREMRPECDHDYVFTTQWGARLGRRGVRSTLRRALAGARLDKPQVTVHTLRHSFACLMPRNGADLSCLQSLLGHTRLDTAGVYVDATAEDLRSAVARHPLSAGD